VQIYPTSALGSLRVTWESMQLGNLEAGWWDTVTPAMMVPLYAGTELPFIFRDLDHVHRPLTARSERTWRRPCWTSQGSNHRSLRHYVPQDFHQDQAHP